MTVKQLSDMCPLTVSVDGKDSFTLMLSELTTWEAPIKKTSKLVFEGISSFGKPLDLAEEFHPIK